MRVIDSDEDVPPSKAKKINSKNEKKDESPKKMKKVDVKSLFGDSPVKRVEKRKPTSKPIASVFLDSDEELEKSLLDMCDASDLNQESVKPKTPKKEELKVENGKPIKHDSPNRKNETHKNHDSPHRKHKSPKKHDSPHRKNETPQKHDSPHRINESPKKHYSPKNEEQKKSDSPRSAPSSQSRTPTVTKSRTAKNPKTTVLATDDSQSDVNPDEERFEKKRLSAILYQKYKNRSGVLNHGCKEIPKGKPNCLAGKIFVITGVLESMEREEAQTLIEEYGGKVTVALSKKTHFMITGEDAGPAKIAKAEDLGTKIISEDDLLTMIRESVDGAVKVNGMSTPKRKLDPPEVKSKIKSENRSPHTPEQPKKKIKLSPAKDTIVKKEKTEKLSPVEVKNEKESPPVKVANVEKELDSSNMAWVDKYKPKTVREIVGQHGDSSNVAK